jgi:hypothetical protein
MQQASSIQSTGLVVAVEFVRSGIKVSVQRQLNICLAGIIVLRISFTALRQWERLTKVRLVPLAVGKIAVASKEPY